MLTRVVCLLVAAAALVVYAQPGGTDPPRRAVKQAGGTDADAAKVWAAIESGKLSRDLMTGLYRECR